MFRRFCGLRYFAIYSSFPVSRLTSLTVCYVLCSIAVAVVFRFDLNLFQNGFPSSCDEFASFLSIEFDFIVRIDLI